MLDAFHVMVSLKQIFTHFPAQIVPNLEVGSLAGEGDRLSRDISTVSRCTNRSGTSYHNTDHLAPADDPAPPMLYKLNFAQVLRVLRFKNVLRNNIVCVFLLEMSISDFSSLLKPAIIAPQIISLVFLADIIGLVM